MKVRTYKPAVTVELTLTFKRRYEARDLLEELQTWTPAQGWSQQAKQLFEGLKLIADNEVEET